MQLVALERGYFYSWMNSWDILVLAVALTLAINNSFSNFTFLVRWHALGSICITVYQASFSTFSAMAFHSSNRLSINIFEQLAGCDKILWWYCHCYCGSTDGVTLQA